MVTENSTKKGKSKEYYLISELLKNDLDVYVPVTDVEGVDMIIKNKEGGYVEIQVKSRTIKDDRTGFKMKDFNVEENFFIVCHNLSTNDEFFVIPSQTFYRNSKLDNCQKRELSYSDLKKYGYRNERGIELLKKGLNNPHNKVKRWSE